MTGNNAASPQDAFTHFAGKLSYETDPADIAYAIKHDEVDFVLVDARRPSAYRQAHLPGAVNVPETGITEDWLAGLPADRLLVTYCWGPACNGSTKAAMKIAALGRPVKEMIGGIEYWTREGYPTIAES